jgi:hypothetical protein
MKDQKKDGVNPVFAAVTGAVVGAGVAIAGAVALSNDKNREKLDDAATSIKDHVADTIKDVNDKVEGKLAEGKEAVKKVVASA